MDVTEITGGMEITGGTVDMMINTGDMTAVISAIQFEDLIG